MAPIFATCSGAARTSPRAESRIAGRLRGRGKQKQERQSERGGVKKGQACLPSGSVLSTAVFFGGDSRPARANRVLWRFLVELVVTPVIAFIATVAMEPERFQKYRKKRGALRVRLIASMRFRPKKCTSTTLDNQLREYVVLIFFRLYRYRFRGMA